MITPEEKDSILVKLIETASDFVLVPNGKAFGLSQSRFESLLRQFISRGLIRVITARHKDEKTGIMTEIEAEDFIQRGGFKFEEDIFRNNFTKLELELAKLEKDNPTINFDNATKLVGAVASGFEIYKNLKL